MEDETTSAVAVALLASATGLLLLQKKKLEKERKRKREAIRNTQHLMKELISNSADYKNFLRMDENCVNFLLTAIRMDIQKQNTILSEAISPEEKLAITLKFLAAGEIYVDLDNISKLSKSFLAEVVIEVCEAIYKNLKDEFLKFPTKVEDWLKIAGDYALKWQFPNCLGALDGKHIAFHPSKKNGALFRNYKGYNSIVLLGLADANLKFIFIDVGCNGRISYDEVLSRSNFMYVLQQPEKCRLPPKKLVGNNRMLPHLFIGDNAFSLLQNLIIPYSFTSIDPNKKTFNYRISRARQTIECAFGILFNRFQIFKKPINLREDKVTKIVLCCCVLHNFLITRNQKYVDTNISVHDNHYKDKETLIENENSTIGEAVREELLNYFNNEGKLNN